MLIYMVPIKSYNACNEIMFNSYEREREELLLKFISREKSISRMTVVANNNYLKYIDDSTAHMNTHILNQIEWRRDCVNMVLITD